MAQMTKCPRCGADNSVRRTTCYVCQAPLAAGAGEPTSEIAPGDRFAAVLRERFGIAQETAAAAPASRAASLLPASYTSTKQVRRAMLLFRQLHALVQSGIPLAKALTELTLRSRRGVRHAVRAMAQHVAKGGRLSDAMCAHPRIFLAYQAALVRMGEVGGMLPQVLGQLATDCEAEYTLRRAIKLAMFPVYVTAVAMLILAPAALALGEPSPGEYWTVATLAARYLSKAATVSLPIALGLGVIWMLSIVASRSPSVAVFYHRLSLSLPLLGGAYRRIGMMRFLGSFSQLLSAGVPIGEAYRSAAGATGNSALTRQLLREADNLYQGRGFGDILARVRVLPGHETDELAIGEMSGNLPGALSRLAEDYRRQVQQSAKHLPRLLQIAGYVVVVPLFVLLWYRFASLYLHFRFYAPLKQLFEVP